MPFGISSSGPSGGGGGVNQDKLDAAVVELDMVTDVFNRMVNSCSTKCVSQRYAENDLTKGEAVCVDRCVGKFIEANKIIGEKLKEQQVTMNPGGM